MWSINNEAVAWLITQPLPVNLSSVTMSLMITPSTVTESPHEGFVDVVEKLG